MFKFFKILLNFILKNFVHFFYKTFSKVFDEYIFAECFSPNRNFGDAIAVQDFSGIHYESLSDVPPPRTKILEPLLLQSIFYTHQTSQAVDSMNL